MPHRGYDSCGCHLSQRGSTVLEGEIVGHKVSEVISIERFRRPEFKKGQCQQLCDVSCRLASGTGECAIDVCPLTGVLTHPVVDQCVAGSGVESENFRSLADPGDIGDPTDIEDCYRL